MTSSLVLFEKLRLGTKIFIETGTFSGDGIEKALDAGYTKIYSCEINPEFAYKAMHRFRNTPFDVYILCSPSKIALKLFLKDIDEPCTIFLDAHSMPIDAGNPELGFGEETVFDKDNPTPLLDELEIIKNHHIKNHVIIIDDSQCFNSWEFNGLRSSEVYKLIKSINEEYQMGAYGNSIYFVVPQEK